MKISTGVSVIVRTGIRCVVLGMWNNVRSKATEEKSEPFDRETEESEK